MRIGTYNIQYGIGLDGRFDLDRIVEVIAPLDIVGLQEVEVSWDRSGNRDIPALLAQLMPDHYVAWGPNIDVIKRVDGKPAGPRAARRQFGNMILSRFPILAIRNHPLPRYGAASLLDMQRGALEATVATPGGNLRVYCTHLCHLTDEQRTLQLEHLLEIIDRAELEGPPLSGSHDRDLSWSSEAPLADVPADAIVLGDFNCTPDSAPYSVLAGEHSARRGRMTKRGRFIDAWDAARERYGLPGGETHDGATRYTENPPQPGKGRRLDFCFLPVHYAGQVISAKVLPEAVGSDHLPVIVELADAGG
jgi:endonuclease/exonuclease/phosphatase family metal-dependent hydrolase